MFGGNPNLVQSRDLPAMNSTKFAKFNVSGWHFAPGARQMRPSGFSLQSFAAHETPGVHYREVFQFLDTTQFDLFWFAPNSERSDCGRGRGIGQRNGGRLDNVDALAAKFSDE